MNSELYKKFNNLDEHLKLKKIYKVYCNLKKVADLQLSKIQEHKKNKNIPKEIIHHYLCVSIEGFWDKVDFFFSLRKNKYRKHNGLIVRSILEQLLQMCFFTLSEKKIKNKIIFQEIARINKRFYDRDTNNNQDPSEWQIKYSKNINFFKNDIIEFNFPSKLSEIKEEQIKPFPPAPELCKLAKKIFPNSDIDKWYDDYRYFCEEEHNGLVINWNKDEKRYYRQNLMYCSTYGRYMVELINRHYLKDQTKKEVLQLNDIYKKIILC